MDIVITYAIANLIVLAALLFRLWICSKKKNRSQCQ